jgi:hypothetical protein
MGYTPVFNAIYSGTLYGLWPAAAVWASILPLMDRYGRLDVSLEAIAGTTGWPLELLAKGIDQLCAPDPGSRSPDEDGRRLVPLDPARPWGWRAVNYAKYRERARLEAKNNAAAAKGAEAQRKREYRARMLAAERDSVRRCPPESAGVRLSDVNVNVNKKQKSASRPGRPEEPPEFAQFWAEYPKRAGSQKRADALKACRARIAEGATWPQIIEGARRYAGYVRAAGTERSPFVMLAATFAGPNREFLNPWETPPAPVSSEKRALEEKNATELARAIAYGKSVGFRKIGRLEAPGAYRSAAEQWDRTPAKYRDPHDAAA